MRSAPPPAEAQTPLMRIAEAGTAIVFLLALAAALNGLVAGDTLPDDLREGAVAAHLISVMLALPLGLSQLLLPKGGRRHRTIGYIWLALMVFTALVSFAIHQVNPKGLSPVHVFSVLTLVSAPLIVRTARNGKVASHRRAVLGLMIGGLMISGVFALLPGRALGSLLQAPFGT